MRFMVLTTLFASLALTACAPILVDHEGGPRRGRDSAYGIPKGHLPPPGECRVWDPDRPAGHQPPPERCD
jgi:hypothetical protein